MDDMSARVATLRSLQSAFEAALRSFTSSDDKFRVVRSVDSRPSTNPTSLHILDSSFNPPTLAHCSLVLSALRHAVRTGKCSNRLLLVFSTLNADKVPNPAGFVQRMILMTAFAEDLSNRFKTEASSATGDISLAIDVGLTKEPYYNDKSVAISQAADVPQGYSTDLKHVHLIGYDTLIRFCNPKYYADCRPPLSALRPFFQAGHSLRITVRPSAQQDESSSEFGSVEQQKAYLQDLRDGRLEDQGFDRAWAVNGLEMVEAEAAVGVSSTRAREAAARKDWQELRKLCTEGVAAWIMGQHMYGGEDGGLS